MDTAILTEDRRQVGPYTLTHCLGIGGMGEVWAGRRTHDSGACKTVAVKLLPPERANNEASRRMFDEEARLSMLLCNSNIVQVFDVGEDAGVHYMAMEWIDGFNLDELGQALRSRAELLPLPIVGYVIGELLKALSYAHDFEHDGQVHTVVHRDVSAHNVMISIAGEVKLMDFGIARLSTEETGGLYIKGKLRYMPPEQLRGDTREPTIDLFAVGAILHELLDGQRFRHDVVDEARLYGMVLDGEIPPLACSPERIPPELDALRLALLEADVSRRVASAREAHRMLASWPGYRDTKFELQDLARAFTKGETSAQLPHVEPSQTRPPASWMSSSRRAPTKDDASRSPLATRMTTQVHGRPSLSLGVALVGGGLLVLTVGVSLISIFRPAPDAVPAASTGRAPPERSAELHPEPTPKPEPAPEPEPEPEPTPEPTPDPEPTQEPEPTPPDLPPPPPHQPEPEPTKIPAKPKARVSVVLTAAPTVFWLEVEIAGRRLIRDRMGGTPNPRTRLRPGTYPVRYRAAGGSWRTGGSVTIPESDKARRLVLRSSGLFELD